MSYPFPRALSLNITLGQRPEIDHAGEQIANAMAAARRAVFLMKTTRFSAFQPNQSALDGLVKTIDDTRVLSDEFNRHASTLRGELEHAETASPDELGIVQTIAARLDEALSLTQRVNDLIAAQQMIGAMRKPRG